VNFLFLLQGFLFLIFPEFSSEELVYFPNGSIEARGGVRFQSDDFLFSSESITFNKEASSFYSESMVEARSGNLVFILDGIYGEFNAQKEVIENLTSKKFTLKINSEEKFSSNWNFSGNDFIYSDGLWNFKNISFGNWEPVSDSGLLIKAAKCTLEKVTFDLYRLNFENVDFHILSKKIFSLDSLQREFRSNEDFGNILSLAPVIQNHPDEGSMLGLSLQDFGVFGGFLSGYLSLSESGKSELFLDGKLQLQKDSYFSLGLGSVFEVAKDGQGYWVSSSPSYSFNRSFRRKNEEINVEFSAGRFSLNDGNLFHATGSSATYKKTFDNFVLRLGFSRFKSNQSAYESLNGSVSFPLELSKGSILLGFGSREVSGLHPIPSRQRSSWSGPVLNSIVNFSENWAFRTSSEWDINDDTFINNQISLIRSFNGLGLSLIFDTKQKLTSFSIELLSF
tara:strand:- start:5517 stop:6869 length:1353 start_codon:yes stop_codon:yes gene_type:complete